MDFSAYSLWIFDCDGVLLESNRMKQAGFAQVLRDYGKTERAEAPQDSIARHGV